MVVHLRDSLGAFPSDSSRRGAAATPTDEITKLAEDVYLFRHQAHQAIFVVTPEGVIVTDPISLEAATWLKIEIGSLTEQPVRYVIYSHHHNDHITGGPCLPIGLFVSHRAARRKVLSEPERVPLPPASPSPIGCPSTSAANT